MGDQLFEPGKVVGERFEIVEHAGHSELGHVYRATDTTTKKFVALRIVPPALVENEEALEAIRGRVKDASSLNHRNIRATFGMGTEETGEVFIATEWIDGHNLRQLLAKRLDAGKRFSFKGAYNIVGHVCNALTYAHKTMAHGGLSPRSVIVNDAGRVKIIDWGLTGVRARLEAAPGASKVEGEFWAPEFLKDPGNISPSGDIFALGAIFYELITGVVPSRPLRAPSQLGFSKDVDKIVARCMAAQPAQRFSNPEEVKNAILELSNAHAEDVTKQATGSVDDNLGIDIDIDLGGMDDDPTVGAAPVAPGSMMGAPGLPPRPADAAPGSSSADMGRASNIDMGAVLANIGKSEAAKWMVQKDKFDHGPFTDRELAQMILSGEVLGKHPLLNMDTGVRKKIKAWGDFDELLEAYRVKKKKQEEAKALQKTERAETRGTVFKLAVGLGVLGVIGLAVAGWFLSRQLRAEKKFDKEELIAAFDSGEIKLKTGGSLETKRKRKGKGRRRKGGGGGGGGEFAPGLSYEDAMNQGVSLGSLTNNGSQRQLTAADIENIMNKHVRKFLPCMGGESTKRVDMNIAVGGNGKVIGVSVKQGSSKLKGCVSSKVRRIKFPASGAPRTATSWYFELY